MVYCFERETLHNELPYRSECRKLRPLWAYALLEVGLKRRLYFKEKKNKRTHSIILLSNLLYLVSFLERMTLISLLSPGFVMVFPSSANWSNTNFPETPTSARKKYDGIYLKRTWYIADGRPDVLACGKSLILSPKIIL